VVKTSSETSPSGDWRERDSFGRLPARKLTGDVGGDRKYGNFVVVPVRTEPHPQNAMGPSLSSPGITVYVESASCPGFTQQPAISGPTARGLCIIEERNWCKGRATQ